MKAIKVVVLAVMLFGLTWGHAQAQQLQPVSKPPETGTFFLLSGETSEYGSPPYPYDPYGGVMPIYQMKGFPNQYLIGDSSEDFQALQSLQAQMFTAGGMTMNSLEFPGEGEEGGGSGYEPMVFGTNDFWLEITGVTNGMLPEGIADLILHGTQPDVLYLLLSKEALTNPVWAAEQIMIGASGQNWTPTNVLVGMRTNTLFLKAISLVDSDGDGLPDWWELENGFDPNNPADGAADADSDGYSNLDEYLLGQNPHSADPARPTITVATTDANAAEPSNAGVFTLTRAGDTSQSLTAYYTLSGLARNGTDFQALNGEAVFAAGQSNAAVVIQPVDDTIYEGAEDLTFTLLPGLHYFNGTVTTGLVTLADNEIQPVKVSAWPEEVTENGGTPGVFQFTRSGDTRSALTVNFTLTGTATNGATYQTVPLSVTFPVDADSTNVSILPLNNTNFFGTRIAQMTVLTNAAYFAETNCGTATVTITDDDKPVVQVVASDTDAREGSPVRNGSFRFTRTGATTQPLEIPFAVHGTAIPGSDYTAFPQSVVIPSNLNFVTLLVTPTNDALSEMRETVIVVLRNSPDYTIGASNSATVFIDDNEPVAYEWELVTASAVNDTSLDLPAEFVIRRYGSTLGSSNFDFTVTDQNGAAIQQPADLFAGDVGNNSSPFLPPGGLRNWVTFNNRRSEAHVLVHHPVSIWTPVGFYPFLNIYVSNLFGLTTDYQTIHFHSRERLMRAEFMTNQITEGGSNILRFRRNVPQVWTPVETNTFSLTFTVDGLAVPGTDHTLTDQAITFPPNVGFADMPIEALSDTNSEGWESVYVRLNMLATDYRPDTRPGSNWMTALNIGDPGLTNNVGLLDSDEDGMADSWEKTYGQNPFVFNDPYADADGDGMPNLEEALNGTNPNTRDSDADGVDDATEWTHGSNANDAGENTINPASDYVRIKLSTASCFKCHQTTLSAGKYSLTSVPPVRGHTVDATDREQIFQFLKGAAYPVHVGGPVTADANAKYTAQILPPTNGAPQEYFLQDPDGMLGTELPVSNLNTKVATLIVPKVELTWQAKGDNLPLDNYTNANGQVMGKRIFVGAKTPTESNARNTVMLKIKVTPPLVGSNVWLRSFDVDDTTREVDDNKGVIDSTGRAGEDNFTDPFSTPITGMFVASSQSSIATNLDANGEATVEFKVGAQPGNNYRIAATVFPTSNLGNLQSSSAVGSNYVSAYTDIIRSGFNGGQSPLLTVWCKLYLEFDSMTAVPTNGPQANVWPGFIRSIKTNSPNPGQSTVMLLPTAWYKTDNELENGELKIRGTPNIFKILGNEFYGSGSPSGDFVYRIIVDGIVPSSAAFASCTVSDDDERFKVDAQLPTLPMNGMGSEILSGVTPSLSSKKIPGVAATFEPAFIKVEDANAAGWNTGQTIPFYLNKDVFDVLLSGVFDDVQDIHDSELFWCHTVTFGFQPGVSEDGDSNSEFGLLGVTPEAPGTDSAFGYSAIYKEAIVEQGVENRGANNDFATKQRLFYQWFLGNIAHETAHAPGKQGGGTDHAEDELMQTGGGPIGGNKSFKPVTILRFRKTSSWTGGPP